LPPFISYKKNSRMRVVIYLLIFTKISAYCSIRRIKTYKILARASLVHQDFYSDLAHEYIDSCPIF
jgi:hypothetical protein